MCDPGQPGKRAKTGRTFTNRQGANMWQFRFSALSGALALVALAVGGSGAARAAATEVAFGDIVPSGLGAGGCSHSGSDPGFVCNNGQTFSGGGDTFTANGYSGNLGGRHADGAHLETGQPQPAPRSSPLPQRTALARAASGKTRPAQRALARTAPARPAAGTSVLVRSRAAAIRSST